jgi:agmatine deiminase
MRPSNNAFVIEHPFCNVCSERIVLDMIQNSKHIKNIEYAPLSENGFFMPAEWEPHSATWVSFPHNEISFADSLMSARGSFVEAVYWLSRGEDVHVNVNDEAAEKLLRAMLDERGVGGNVFIHHLVTDDAWCRDHGAIFLKHKVSGDIVATDWSFNAWGKKYPYSHDERVARRMAAELHLRCYSSTLVLEGGAIETDGDGVLLTTESCLLNPNRNPELTKKDIEVILRETFGFAKILWLAEGIAGDDTDGHIDDITRFVNPITIVTAREDDPRDINFVPLQKNYERLQSASDINNEPYTIVLLPMPEALYHGSDRLPASYANFYIANSVVLVPTFGCPQDECALEILTDCFQGREVIGIDARAIVVGRGSFHCLTQQVPA